MEAVNPRAVGWRIRDGAVQEVIDLGTRSGINGTVTRAVAVNNKGQILVTATVEGSQRTFILLP